MSALRARTARRPRSLLALGLGPITVAMAVTVATVATVPGQASAAEPVKVLVLKEHGVGSASSAQGFVDRLMGRVAQVNGFPAATGKYETTRRGAKAYIAEHAPHFGILSLAAFLDLRGAHKLSVVGKVDVGSAGGRRYHLVSKTAANAKACKGKAVASDHFDDRRFVDKVVAGGAFEVGDFEVVETRRPVQTLKKVIDGEAVCALVDDAQLAYLAKLDGGAAVQSVWASKELPPMVVVAFGTVDKGGAASFKKKLSEVCKGEGKSACAEVGIVALEAASDADYASIVKAY